MKFQGDISAIAVTDVVQNLANNRKTGTLAIQRGEVLRKIVFQDGKIASYWDNAGFSIPRWVEDKGIVDPDTLKRALQNYRKSRKKTLGEMLHQAGAINHEDYLHHVKDLFQEVIYETFSFRDGTFEFHENKIDPESVDREIAGSKIELQAGPVLIESARRLDEWEAIRRSLPSDCEIYQVHPSERTALKNEMREDELAMAAIDLLDGTRTVREVVAALPAGRFDACRVLADLVSRKAARPVDGNVLVDRLQAGTTPAEKSRALVGLKVALDREPGNRTLIQKVAELSLELGNKEESGVHRKLLAGALLEDGDIAGAERELRQSLKLNVKDISAWQKLYETLERKGDGAALLVTGRDMARQLRKMGLEERARDQLARMLERFAGHVDLRLEHADTLFALGSRAESVQCLLELARDLLKRGQSDESERVLAKVLEYDRDHKKAREIYDKLRTGKHARQRAKRRAFIRSAAGVLAIVGLGAFFGYDLYARRDFTIATREVFAEGLLEKGNHRAAIDRLEAVRQRHRYSLTALLEGREFLRAIKEAETRHLMSLPPLGPPLPPDWKPPPPPAAPIEKRMPVKSDKSEKPDKPTSRSGK